jgi:hypothetical protein
MSKTHMPAIAHAGTYGGTVASIPIPPNIFYFFSSTIKFFFTLLIKFGEQSSVS